MASAPHDAKPEETRTQYQHTGRLRGSCDRTADQRKRSRAVSGFPPRAEPLKLAMSLRSTFITLPSVSVTLLPEAPSDQIREPPLIVLP